MSALEDGYMLSKTGTRVLPRKTDGKVRRVVLAGAMGTLIEYFDYSIYAFLATTIAVVFFPASDSLALLYTFGLFGVAFVVRPLGGIIIGGISDRYGRKPALMISVFGMIIATAVIGLLPSYASVGIAAPLLLCLMRCIQGIAAGGELGGAAAYVAEVSPNDRRGALTSTTQVGCLAGTMLGALCVAQLSSALTHEQMLDWGWRIPFLLSVPLGIATLFVRRRMEESEQFQNLEDKGQVTRIPIWSAMRDYPRGVLTVAGLSMISFSAYYLVFTYLVTYFQQQSIMSAQVAGWSSSVTMLLAAGSIYFWGQLSDRIGRKPILIGCCLGLLILPYPMFLLMNQSVESAIAAQLILGLVVAAYLGVIMSTYCELFPPHIRTTGVSLGFNIAALVAGGSSPYLATWLINETGQATAPAWIMMGAALISLGFALTLKETANRPLREC